MNRMKIIPSIWFVFTVLFACFAVHHFVQLNHSYPCFDWVLEEGLAVEFYSGTAKENRINLTKFVTQWNEYIHDQNETSFRLNLTAAISYLITATMSCIAMFIPGPYNIRDFSRYLYKRCAQSNLCMTAFRHITQKRNKRS